MEHFDGIFSEGSTVNSVGLLGNQMTTVLWTYTAKECCNDAATADQYFQTRLSMGVYPMAPFPGNDHSIPRNVTAEQFYLRYGPAFRAMRTARWNLFPHAIELLNATGNPAKGIITNAFRTISYDLWSVMNAGMGVSSATVRICGAPNSRFEVLNMTTDTWATTPAIPDGDCVQVTVSLWRGCAMIRAP
jgi:hypothetical protein